jgi:hypothetical protein
LARVADHTQAAAQLAAFTDAMPHALCLEDAEGGRHVLLPNCSLRRAVVKKEPFSVDVAAQRVGDAWLGAVDKPYFLYHMHGSGAFLEAPSPGRMY